MREVLLDSGAIVALLDQRDVFHSRCVEAFGSVSAPLVTCEAVIAEACHLLRRVPGAVDRVLENVRLGTFELPFRAAVSANMIHSVIQKYSSVPASFADACLICLAEELSTGAILTLDSDFRIYRWRRNRHFQLLISIED